MAKKRTNKPAAKAARSNSSTTSRVTRIKASDSESTKASKPTTKKPTASKKTTKSTSAKQATSKLDSLRKISLRRKKSVVVDNPADSMDQPPTKNPFKAMGRYFKGSWFEINQVRWPDRATTWQMTGALLAFTAFFVLVIILLDSIFKYLFEFILG